MVPAFPFHPPLRLGHYGLGVPSCSGLSLSNCDFGPYAPLEISLGLWYLLSRNLIPSLQDWSGHWDFCAGSAILKGSADHLKKTDRRARAIKTMIVCGSKYGSTKMIGEWIAERLRFESLVTYLKDAPSPRDFDLVILGSAIYHGRLLPKFEAYIDRYMSTLEEKKKAVFAVCLDTAGFYVKGDVHGGWQYIMPLIKKFKNPPLHAGVLHGEINPSKLTAEDSKMVARFYGRQSVPYVTKMNKEEVWDFAERILNKLDGGNKKGKSA
jgi:menaquinone-dependent protoporphyrinogen IX oxidase